MRLQSSSMAFVRHAMNRAERANSIHSGARHVLPTNSLLNTNISVLMTVMTIMATLL